MKLDNSILPYLQWLVNGNALNKQMFIDNINVFLPQLFKVSCRVFLMRFENTFVNKELIKGYEKEFSVNHAEFPKWSALYVDRDNPTQINFGIFYEPYSPNWNNEYKKLSTTPIDKLDTFIITDIEKGLSRFDTTLKKLFIQSSYKTFDELPNYGKHPTKEQLAELIQLGMACVYRRGWAYRGASARNINKDEALSMLSKYEYGKGFYSLNYSVKNNAPILEFNELSELDME